MDLLSTVGGARLVQGSISTCEYEFLMKEEGVIVNYRYSDRILAFKPSATREILKLSASKDLISFAAGNPAPDAFPVKAVGEITAKVLAEDPIAVLQYSLSEGYTPLRELTKHVLQSRYGIDTTGCEVLITSGAQQGADLVAKAFVNKGDTVIAEDPSFMGCLNAFRSYECNLVGVPMEEDGIDVAKLEEALKANPNTKFVYLIPNFQNPTGITMSVEKRKQVYALAVKYDVLILEDNPYGELRIKGEHLPPIKSFDTTGHVIYMGSYSKIIAPGLRVGYLLAPEDMLPRLALGKQASDVHTTMLAQYICERFISQYDLEQHLVDLVAIYRRKCELMLGEMDKHMSPAVTWTKPEGGMFIYCTLPGDTDSIGFYEEAIARGVACVPGVSFLVDQGQKSSSFRLNFSTPTDENIAKGIEILGKLTYDYLKQ